MRWGELGVEVGFGLRVQLWCLGSGWFGAQHSHPTDSIASHNSALLRMPSTLQARGGGWGEYLLHRRKWLMGWCTGRENGEERRSPEQLHPELSCSKRRTWSRGPLPLFPKPQLYAQHRGCLGRQLQALCNTQTAKPPGRGRPQEGPGLWNLNQQKCDLQPRWSLLTVK